MNIVMHSARARTRCDNCGQKIYWGHDTDRPAPYGKRGDCKHSPTANSSCKANGKFVPLTYEAAYSFAVGDTVPAEAVHNCRKAATRKPAPAPVIEPVISDPFAAPAEVATPAQVEAVAEETSIPEAELPTELGALLDLLRKVLGNTMDEAAVEKIVRKVVNDTVFPTRTVVLETANAEPKVLEGTTHRQLADVLVMMKSRHVYLVGPAGTGKSTIVEHAAEALGRTFASISLTAWTPESALRGFIDAGGTYHRTMFRDAFEYGFVFCIDEIDHGDPNTIGVMNAALSNGQMAFPDGMVKRHPNFRCVATANTYGAGIDREYVGATQLDAASLDRFAFLPIDIDDALEASMVAATGVEVSTQTKILDYVRRLRRNRDATAQRVVISPRASVGMAEFIRDGLSWDMAVDSNIRKGAPASVWNKIDA